jgi:beta-galactosidase/beta-glucuronidase
MKYLDLFIQDHFNNSQEDISLTELNMVGLTCLNAAQTKTELSPVSLSELCNLAKVSPSNLTCHAKLDTLLMFERSVPTVMDTLVEFCYKWDAFVDHRLDYLNQKHFDVKFWKKQNEIFQTLMQFVDLVMISP